MYLRGGGGSGSGFGHFGGLGFNGGGGVGGRSSGGFDDVFEGLNGKPASCRGGDMGEEAFADRIVNVFNGFR